MIVTLLLWFTLGILVGVLAFFGGLLTLPMSAPKRHAAAEYYTTVAQKLMGAAALVERGTGYDIFSTNHDTDKNADKVDIDGQTAHVSNETGLKSTLAKKPFGLVAPPTEDIAVYLSPEIGEFGEVESDRREHGELRDDDGYDPDVDLDPKRPMVKLRRHARAMIPGSRSLWDLSETVDLYRQSQAGFADSKSVQLMILVVAYGVGALITWLVATNAGGAAPTGVDLPSLMLMPGVGL